VGSFLEGGENPNSKVSALWVYGIFTNLVQNVNSFVKYVHNKQKTQEFFVRFAPMKKY